MRKNGFHQFLLRGLQRNGDSESLNQFGHALPDHMRTQERAGVPVENGFNQPLVRVARDGLTVGVKRETTNANIPLARILFS